MAIQGGWLATPSTPPGSVPAVLKEITHYAQYYELLQLAFYIELSNYLMPGCNVQYQEFMIVCMC